MAYSEWWPTVDNWLADIVNGNEPAVLDGDGKCSLLAVGQVGITICVPPDSDRIYIYADVIAIPEQQNPDFYEELLGYNAQPDVTLGLVLSFAVDARMILASYSTEIDRIDSVDLKNILGNMTTLVSSFRSKLANGKPGSPDSREQVPISIRV